jgi:hypothetical protein
MRGEIKMHAGGHQMLPSEAYSVAPADGSLSGPVIIGNQALAVKAWEA